MDRSTHDRTMREIWSDHEARQRFEHDLINRKTTWLLTTQALLFAAYALTFDKEAQASDPTLTRFRDVVAWTALAVAAVILVGVTFLIRSKYLSWRAYQGFFDRVSVNNLPGPLAGKPLPWGVSTANTVVTLAPDVALPIVFIWMWGYLIVKP